MNPLKRQMRTLAQIISGLEALTKPAPRYVDTDEPLPDAELDGEALEPTPGPPPLTGEAWAPPWMDKYRFGFIGPGNQTLVANKAIDDELTWEGWALPAIYDVLVSHYPRPAVNTLGAGGIFCSGCDDCPEFFVDSMAWREHVGDVLVRRIGCNPDRAIIALSKYHPDE